MFKKHILKNGMRLITAPLKGTKTVAVLALVSTGSNYEEKEMSGISHFLEHMMFKGTKKRKDTLAITEELDGIGAEYNAFTSNEYTGYYVKSDYTHLDIALDIVSDVLVNSIFHPKEISKEKGVVIEEINMYRDNPQRQVAQYIENLLYGDQPAGRDVTGTKETVSAITRSGLTKYFNSQYTAKNTVVCVAGNFDIKTIESKVENYFSSFNGGEPKEKAKVFECQKEPASFIQYKDTDQTHFFIAVRSFISMFDQRRFPLNLLANILGGTMSSRLFTRIREKKGLAYYISSGVDVSADTGYLWVRAGVNNQKAFEAISAVLKELRKIKQKGVTQKELKKAKEYFKGKTFMEIESSDELASFLGMQEVLKNEIMTPEEILKNINNVTVSDINKIAKDILKNENLNLALIGPFKDKKKFEDLLKI